MVTCRPAALESIVPHCLHTRPAYTGEIISPRIVLCTTTGSHHTTTFTVHQITLRRSRLPLWWQLASTWRTSPRTRCHPGRGSRSRLAPVEICPPRLKSVPAPGRCPSSCPSVPISRPLCVSLANSIDDHDWLTAAVGPPGENLPAPRQTRSVCAPTPLRRATRGRRGSGAHRRGAHWSWFRSLVLVSRCVRCANLWSVAISCVMRRCLESTQVSRYIDSKVHRI